MYLVYDTTTVVLSKKTIAKVHIFFENRLFQFNVAYSSAANIGSQGGKRTGFCSSNF
jgi:hypothetical protein